MRYREFERFQNEGKRRTMAILGTNIGQSRSGRAHNNKLWLKPILPFYYSPNRVLYRGNSYTVEIAKMVVSDTLLIDKASNEGDSVTGRSMRVFCPSERGHETDRVHDAGELSMSNGPNSLDPLLKISSLWNSSSCSAEREITDLADHNFQFLNILFPPLTGDNSVQRKLEFEGDFGSKPYKEEGRIVRGSIQRPIHPILQLETDEEEAQVVYDIFQCHEWMHDVGRLRCRDFNIANIMFRRGLDGQVFGILHDFDLTTMPRLDDSEDHVPTPSKHRIGIPPFDCHLEKDRYQWNCLPCYRHEAESIFYLVFILGDRYNNVYGNFNYRLLTEAKGYGRHRVLRTPSRAAFFGQTNFGYQQWMDGFQPLWLKAVEAFEEYWGEGEKDLDKDAGKDNELNDAFDLDTLGGLITVDKIRNILNKFNGKDLKSRVFLS
ncbi:hypothetical protein BDP27DRAFT_316633 [Rhodocollybia butyracea]|uniref:Uncharacterized protein n=1 Tax=Rhodocollybia butyracea TaxID=206335 RepID=A0A9P5Q0E7_9AGAR|nr:hypothetical protein BDP27DRAFT_316633 [Rhodocollybia butyracea]